MKTLIATLMVMTLASPMALAKKGENAKACNGNNSSVGLHDNTSVKSQPVKEPARPKQGGKQTS